MNKNYVYLSFSSSTKGRIFSAIEMGLVGALIACLCVVFLYNWAVAQNPNPVSKFDLIVTMSTTGFIVGAFFGGVFGINLLSFRLFPPSSFDITQYKIKRINELIEEKKSKQQRIAKIDAELKKLENESW